MDWEYKEPLKTNRWVIKLKGFDAPEYLFSKYKIFNDGEKLMFSTEVREFLHDVINPNNLFNIDEVRIEFLDPIGNIINGLVFIPKTILFEQNGDYSNDDILHYKLLIEINRGSLFRIYNDKKNENKNG